MPNENKQLNFTLKVWDATTQSYKPCYIAPDATNTVQGDVRLSDSTVGTENAATGMTAATPAAVKAVQDAANNKLDKVSTSDQEVASKVTFNGAVVGSAGITVPSGQYFRGDLDGNAETASELQTARNITIRAGKEGTQTATTAFKGNQDVEINLNQVDASIIASVNGSKIPLDALPDGAVERLVKVENESARFALTTDNVQLGDTVLQMDTEVMYVVVDVDHLDSEAGYQEYAAGTAVLAETAEKVQNGLTVQKGGVLQFTYDGSQAQTINVAASFEDLEGQIAADQIPDGIIDDDKLGVNYAGSDTKGGVATSAAKLSEVRNVTLTGPVTASGTFDGSADLALATTIPDGAITTTMIADYAISTDKLGDNAVTAEKILDGEVGTDEIADLSITAAKIAASTITGDKIASATITGSNIQNNAITSAQLADNSVTTQKIAADAVNLSKLANDVGTVAVQTEEPTDSNVKIWVKI